MVQGTTTGRGDQGKKALEAKLARERHTNASLEKQLAIAREDLAGARSELQSLLMGGVQMLTEVLSLARPELFQKATKVQRWARTLAPQLKLERPWELDLAAILYPYGLLPLSEDVVTKYARGEALDESEQILVDQSAIAGAEIVSKLPRMQPVAQAILYSRKGYDGTGFPSDGVKGLELPLASRVLKVLIDAVDCSTGPGRTRAEAFSRMAERRNIYDLRVLKMAYQVLVVDRARASIAGTVRTLPPGQLLVGDVVYSDIVDSEGRLLLAAGAELTEIGVQRLVVAHREGRLDGAVSVTRDPGQEAA